MAKKGSSLKLKHISEDEAFQLQQKPLEELYKEIRKVGKSLQRIKEKKKEDADLIKAKKRLEAYHTKHKQAELKEIEGYKKALKEARATLNEGAEDILEDIKEINRNYNQDKAPYVEKMKFLDRMISEKEFKI